MQYFEDNGFRRRHGKTRIQFRAGCVARNKRPSHQAGLCCHKGVDAVYLLAPPSKSSFIAPLELDFGVPVVQAIVARVWEIQKRLKVHEPVKGYGRLLESLPA
jgi:maleate cis-trans isomerase